MSSRVSSHHWAEALVRLASDDVDAKTLSAAVDRLADELIAAGRARWLPEILAAFEALQAAAEGRVQVRVETATALTAAQRNELAESLGVSAKKLDVHEEVAPTLAAGLRITVDDRVVAQTVRDRTNRLFAKETNASLS